MSKYASIVRHAARWILWSVLLFTSAIGFLFLTRGTAVQRVRGVAAAGTPVAPAESTFALAVAVLTGAALLPGNRVELALDGNETFPRLWADLRSAQQSITIQVYSLSSGSVADTLARIIVDRARAGVRVYLLYDAFGADVPETYMQRLRAAGVQVAPFRPLRLSNLWVIQNRSHVRGIVVDGLVAWTGGFGIGDKWLGDGRHAGQWRETNVRFTGPAVRQLQAAFVAGWTEATGELFTGRGSVDHHDNGVALAGVLFTSPTLGSTPAERYLALSIAGARERLYVTNAYFAPDDNFTALLARAAERGVDVRILVGGPSTDVPLARLAGRGRYELLLAAGVRVFEYEPSTLHAKTFVVDGRWVSIGSMNFDNRSLALNDEAAMMVLDTLAGQRMEEVFLKDMEFAHEILSAEFRQRPRSQRIGEWFANLVIRVL